MCTLFRFTHPKGSLTGKPTASRVLLWFQNSPVAFAVRGHISASRRSDGNIMYKFIFHVLSAPTSFPARCHNSNHFNTSPFFSIFIAKTGIGNGEVPHLVSMGWRGGRVRGRQSLLKLSMNVELLTKRPRLLNILIPQHRDKPFQNRVKPVSSSSSASDSYPIQRQINLISRSRGWVLLRSNNCYTRSRDIEFSRACQWKVGETDITPPSLSFALLCLLKSQILLHTGQGDWWYKSVREKPFFYFKIL